MNYTWIIVGQNCQDYVKPCLDSVLSQRVPEGCEVFIVCIDDCSDDNTSGKAQLVFAGSAYGRGHANIRLTEHVGAARARYEAMRIFQDIDVFLLLDLDDYLAGDGVLERVHAEYEKGAQATFGNWRFHEEQDAWPWQPLTPHEIASGAFRSMPFACPPLRTFRADVALQVTPAELRDDNGNWLRCCTDVALSWAVLDRVDAERVAYIQDEIYVYRGFHENVTRKRYRREKREVMEMLRRRKGVRV